MDSTDSGRDTAKELASGVPVSDSFDEVLEDDSIRAIALATPAETHAELSIKAMELGKDVFVEKPMALIRAGCREDADVAEGERVSW